VLFYIKFEGVRRGSGNAPMTCEQLVEADDANAAVDKLHAKYSLVHLPMVRQLEEERRAP
jgi:hypothetical protein